MLVALTRRTEVQGIGALISLEMLTSLKLVRLTKPKVIVISRLARSTMLSKILFRSGLSRLFWIKDTVSHRLNGCVLELYGLLVLFKLLARCLTGFLPVTASLSLSTALHQLLKSISISLACQPACLYPI